jgi:hypothetical protein
MSILRDAARERRRRAQALYDSALSTGRVASKEQAVEVIARHTALPEFARRQLDIDPELDPLIALDTAAWDFIESDWASLPRWRRAIQRRSDMREIDARAAGYSGAA